MANQFERSMGLIGKKGLQCLNNSKVAVFGIGGVGSFAAEALIRAGIGNILLIDKDTIALSNLNRQLIALHSTIGQHKVDVMQKRGYDINPLCNITTQKIFFDATTLPLVDLKGYDYIVDAIDTVSSKLLLAEYAFSHNIPLISCMGTGNKLNASMFRVVDIFDTKNCPLARVMRQELKKRNIPSLKVVFSEEPPKTPQHITDNGARCVPASISFVPPVAGMIIAGEVISDLLKEKDYA